MHKDEAITTFFWKEFECVHCKVEFPLSFKDASGKEFPLIDYEKNTRKDEDYIILEGLKNRFVRGTSKYVHIVRPSTENTQFSIGGDEDHLKIVDREKC